MLKLLVTDGTYKNSLAILRCLDTKKYQIDVTSSAPRYLSLCFYSKYCSKKYRIKPNIKNIDNYADKLIKILTKKNYDIFLPVGLWSYQAASKYKEKIKKVTNLVVPDWERMTVASNKEQTMEFANKIGIPIPETHVINTDNDLGEITRFPAVLKSSDEASKSIRYCNDKSEVKKRYEELRKIARTKIIAQEHVKGFGCGFYGVYRNSELLTHFLHRRIKEFPVTGGPSAVAESYFDKKLYSYGKKLCDALKWNGPIMAEFKYDIVKQDYKLIEINPKLWGSLDLTIEAGINVPKMLIDIALDKKISEKSEYKNIRYRWVFPDEFKVLLSVFSLKNVKEFKREAKMCRSHSQLLFSFAKSS